MKFPMKWADFLRTFLIKKLPGKLASQGFPRLREIETDLKEIYRS